MELVGERLIAAPIRATWDSLNDPEVLRSCIAGCESLERVQPDTLLAVLVARVGPVSARFKGTLRLSDMEPPHRYVVSFEGQGGMAGFGKGSADVSLTDMGDQTMLRYAARAQVGGRLAQVGSRLIDAAASKMTADFFSSFEGRFQSANEVAAAPDAPMAPADSVPSWSARSSEALLSQRVVTAVRPATVPVSGGELASSVAAPRSPSGARSRSGTPFTLAGETLFPAPVFATFNALTRAEVLRPCIVGCESLRQVRADTLMTVLAFGAGPFKLRMRATLQVSDVEIPDSYVLSFQGRGGSQGAADITLVEEGHNTRVRYALRARARGPLALLGSTLIESVSALLARIFISRFEKRLRALTSVAPKRTGERRSDEH